MVFDLMLKIFHASYRTGKLENMLFQLPIYFFQLQNNPEA